MSYVRARSKPNFALYFFLFANMIPIFGMFGNLWQLSDIGYFYWAECAILGLFAVGIYARYLAIFMVISLSLLGLVYVTEPSLLAHYKTTLLYWAIYSICVMAYIEIGRSNFGSKIKKMPTPHKFGIYIAFLLLSICFTLVLTRVLHPYLGYATPYAGFEFYRILIALSLLAPSISLAMMKMISMIGEKHFVDFLLGTYHTPVENENIVVFLDMVGSSAVAERLGPHRSMDMIARFIYDCSYIFRIYGGDILSYTGDGLVVIWPHNKSHNALSAMYALRKHFAVRTVKVNYWKRFGMVPDFRIGAHKGPVVISQIGEEKLFLGLYGDTVNAAARLEQLNKELDTKILVSEAVIIGAGQTWKAILKPMGEQTLRGRESVIRTYTILSEV